MTLGVGLADRSNLAALLSEVEDRRLLAASSGTIEASPGYELSASIDPSNGVNYAGGSSYTPGLPLLPSNAGLVGYQGGLRDIAFGDMSYREAMDWSPSPMTERISALRAGAGRTFEGLGAAESMNPMWYFLAAGALAWVLLGRRREPSW